MRTDRAIGVASLLLTAVAVSDKAEDLYKRIQSRRAERVEARNKRDQAYLDAQEADFQRKWREIEADLR